MSRSPADPRWPYGGRKFRDPQSGEPAVHVEQLTAHHEGTSIPAIVDLTLHAADQMREDTAIGVFFAGMFALGITLISTVRTGKASDSTPGSSAGSKGVETCCR